MGMNQMLRFIKQLSGRLSSSIYASVSKQNDASSMAFLRQLQREIKAEDILHIPFSQLKVVVFDIETTSLYPKKGRHILSIGAVKVCGDQIIDDKSYYSLVRNEQSLADKEKSLTGINEDEHQHAPSLDTVLKDFYQFIKSQPLVTEHADYRKSIMQQATWTALKMSFQHRLIDSSLLTTIVEPEISLDSEDEKGHHALHNALGTAKLWTNCVRSIQTRGFSNLSEVYTYAEKNK